MTRALTCPAIIAATLLAIVIGCDSGADYPQTYTVTGVVLLDGNPVEQATVRFKPESTDGKTTVSYTDATGKFEASTSFDTGNTSIPGMLPGEYRVTVTKLDHNVEPGFYGPLPNRLPPKYAKPEASGLTATVETSDTNHFKFELKAR